MFTILVVFKQKIMNNFPIFALLIFTSCSHAIRENNDLFPKHNPVFKTPHSKELQRDEIFFRVEIPSGGTKKYELRTNTGSIIMDRVLCKRKISGTNNYLKSYPLNYGISPGRFNIDGDPLDLIVLGGDEEYRQMIQTQKYLTTKVKILGTIKMQECSKVPCLNQANWEDDWKILAVHPSPNKTYKYHSIADVSEAKLEEISTFFSNYKGVRPYKEKFYPQTRVSGLIGQEVTLKYIKGHFPKLSKKRRSEEIKDCHRIFKDRIINQNYQNSKDVKYLNCLQRVSFNQFLPHSTHFRNYLQYSMYQRLFSLKHKNPQINSAISQMQERKRQGKSYYRYVSYDSPSPGTKQPIFDLVKTKNRNKGCPPNFPDQHYETRPLIDLLK